MLSANPHRAQLALSLSVATHYIHSPALWLFELMVNFQTEALDMKRSEEFFSSASVTLMRAADPLHTD